MIHPPVNLLLSLVADNGPFTQFSPSSHLTRNLLQRMRWWTSVTPALRGLKQADREFKTSLGYSEFRIIALSLCWMGSDQFPVASIESARVFLKAPIFLVTTLNVCNF